MRPHLLLNLARLASANLKVFAVAPHLVAGLKGEKVADDDAAGCSKGQNQVGHGHARADQRRDLRMVILASRIKHDLIWTEMTERRW